MPRKSSAYNAKAPKASISLLPKTDKQREYIKALNNNSQIIVPAGTGKTYIAATRAAQLFSENRVEKIILTRPNVPAGRSLGFFPGTLEEKVAPWVVPFVDVLNEHLGEDVVDIALKKQNIQIVPFEVMRGRTFKNAFVILDEAQNASPTELKMFLTRIGENSQTILNGDILQHDLRGDSGLAVVIDIVQKQKLPVPVIEFSMEDIVRSDACAMWVKAFHVAKV